VYTVTNEVDIASNVNNVTDVQKNMNFSSSHDVLDVVLDFTSTDTVSTIKQKIYELKGIQPTKQRIILKDQLYYIDRYYLVYGTRTILSDDVIIQNLPPESTVYVNLY